MSNKERVLEVQPRGYSVANAALYLGLSESFLNKARVNQTKLPGPVFVRFGHRCLYRKEDLAFFLDNPPS